MSFEYSSISQLYRKILIVVVEAHDLDQHEAVLDTWLQIYAGATLQG